MATWSPFFYNYPGLNLSGLLAFVVSLMSGAVVLTWLYNSTGGSILAAALWHGAFNAATASGEGPMSALGGARGPLPVGQAHHLAYS